MLTVQSLTVMPNPSETTDLRNLSPLPKMLRHTLPTNSSFSAKTSLSHMPSSPSNNIFRDDSPNHKLSNNTTSLSLTLANLAQDRQPSPLCQPLLNPPHPPKDPDRQPRQPGQSLHPPHPKGPTYHATTQLGSSAHA